MANKIVNILFIVFLSCTVLIACKPQEETEIIVGPVDIYWQYWEACDNRKLDLAATYLTSEAELDSLVSGVGVCAYTHDFAYRSGRFIGPPENLELFSKATPTVNQEESRTSLMWVPIEGSTTPIVVLKLVDGIWKIDEIHIMF